MNILSNCRDIFKDIVFPPLCPICYESIDSKGLLCPLCWQKMYFIEKPYCERLGIPFSNDLGENIVSPQALVNPPVYTKSRFVTNFSNKIARKLIHILKYQDRLDLVYLLGSLMAKSGKDILINTDTLIPIPLHYSKLLLRNFNQSAKLAQIISKLTDIPVDSFILKKIKRTTSQVGMPRKERLKNFKDSFIVINPNKVYNKHVTLVDDVFTTGATVTSAAKAILKHKPKSINVLAFARV